MYARRCGSFLEIREQLRLHESPSRSQMADKLKAEGKAVGRVFLCDVCQLRQSQMISKFDGFIEANLRDAHCVSTNFRLFYK